VAARGEATLAEAATTLNISPSTVRRLIEDCTLTAQQFCKGAPWVIQSSDLDRSKVKKVAQARRLRIPSSGNQQQKELKF
jgi:excisionase family DNA binding protein